MNWKRELEVELAQIGDIRSRIEEVIEELRKDFEKLEEIESEVD